MVRYLARAGARLAETAAGSPPHVAVAGSPLPRAITGPSLPRVITGAPLLRPTGLSLRRSAVLPLRRPVAGSALCRPVDRSPLCRPFVGSPLWRGVHSVVVVVDSNGDTSYVAERLTKVVNEELTLIRSDKAKPDEGMQRLTEAPLPVEEEQVPPDSDDDCIADGPPPCRFESKPALDTLFDYQNKIYRRKLNKDAKLACAREKICKEEAVFREAQAGKDAEAREEKAKLEAEAKKVVSEARKELLQKKANQRMLTEVYSSVKRLEAGHAPPQILVAFGRLASIQKVVNHFKSEADKAKKKLEDEKLWIYVFRDRCLEKLPKPVVACIESAREIWGTAVDLYPMVVLIFLLSSYPPDQLFGIALEAHDVYVEDVKLRLKKLHEKHEDRKKQRALAECPEAAISTWVCAKNRSAGSIWACVKSRLLKMPPAPPGPAAVVPQSVADSPRGGADAPPQASQEGSKKGPAPVSPSPLQASQEVSKNGPAPVSLPPTQASQEVREKGPAPVSLPPTQASQEVRENGTAPVSPPPPQDSQEVSKEGPASVSPLQASEEVSKKL